MQLEEICLYYKVFKIQNCLLKRSGCSVHLKHLTFDKNPPAVRDVPFFNTMKIHPNLTKWEDFEKVWSLKICYVMAVSRGTICSKCVSSLFSFYKPTRHAMHHSHRATVCCALEGVICVGEKVFTCKCLSAGDCCMEQNPIWYWANYKLHDVFLLTRTSWK